VQSVEPIASTSTVSVPACCRKGICKGEKRDSPTSPDPDSNEEREWQSDTSEPSEVRKPYRPEVSTVSSDVTVDHDRKTVGKGQCGKRKESWQQSKTSKRVAHVRPQSAPVRRRAMVHRRRGTIPPEFRMVVQAPVVQTHDVVSRITMADGMVMEESMRLRCAIAADVATQTTLTMAMIAVALGETRPVDRATEVPEEAEVIDLTEDEQTGEESTGTPVQDEKLP
jgi:hypothetical protein